MNHHDTTLHKDTFSITKQIGGNHIPRLSKDKAEELNLLILKGDKSDKELAKKYGQTVKAVWDRRKKLNRNYPEPLKYVQRQKNEIVEQTKSETIKKRWSMIGLMEAPLYYLQERIKAWKKTDKSKEPLTRSDIITLTTISDTIERILKGIDKAEGIADTLINVDQRQVHIHQDSRIKGEWSQLCPRCQKILSEIYLRERR